MDTNSLEQTIALQKVQLKDYESFKSKVKLKSKLQSFILGSIGVSAVFLAYNLYATIRSMVEYEVPSAYFFDVFFSMEGGDILYTVLSVVAIVLLVASLICFIIMTAKKEQDYRKTYQEFTTDSYIEAVQYCDLYNGILITFDDPYDTQRMCDLMNNPAFIENKRVRKFIHRKDLANKMSSFSKYLRKDHDFHSDIKEHSFAKSTKTISIDGKLYVFYVGNGRKHKIVVF